MHHQGLDLASTDAVLLRSRQVSGTAESGIGDSEASPAVQSQDDLQDFGRSPDLHSLHTDADDADVSDDEQSTALRHEAAQEQWRQQRRALQQPKHFSAKDRFLLTERARAVFTMQAWQAQTAELMRMAV